MGVKGEANGRDAATVVMMLTMGVSSRRQCRSHSCGHSEGEGDRVRHGHFGFSREPRRIVRRLDLSLRPLRTLGSMAGGPACC